MNVAPLLDPTIRPGSSTQDDDPAEIREWLEALEAVVSSGGIERARYLLDQLDEQARNLGIVPHQQAYSAYRNTIPLDRQGGYPGNLRLEERITAINRWNALAMVARANAAFGELGGHIATYASVAEIFEIGFHHFFR